MAHAFVPADCKHASGSLTHCPLLDERQRSALLLAVTDNSSGSGAGIAAVRVIGGCVVDTRLCWLEGSNVFLT